MRVRLLLLGLLFGLCGCGADAEQSRLCIAAIGALTDDPDRVMIVARERAAGPEHGVTIRWARIGATAAGGPDSPAASAPSASAPSPGAPVDPQKAGTGDDRDKGTLTCTFAGGAFEPGRLDLVGVTVEGRGPLSATELFWLDRWLALPSEFLPKPADRTDPGGPWLPLLYALQQLMNAVTLACVYGLLALGYTMVYAVLGQINLAFGEFAMLGAVTAMIVGAVLAMTGAEAPLALAALLVPAAAVGMAAAWSSDRLVFAQLRRSAPHMPLIAAIGLSLVLQEAARLLQGSDDLWMQPPLTQRFILAGPDSFPLVLSASQLLVLGVTLTAWGGVDRLLRLTRFGLAHRACAGDRQAAALMGIDADAVVARTFALGGALAGLAGFVVVEHYGIANFFMGLILGFKALAAAIIGGLGSVRGAMLGAAIVALLEIFWAAYFDLAAKDVAIFGLLTLILIFRPAGLLGRPE